jgi:hypothetical protein
MTYFRAGGHYHRPQELNDRVRNGNEWDLLGKVTGKQQARQPEPHSPVGLSKWQQYKVEMHSSSWDSGLPADRLCCDLRERKKSKWSSFCPLVLVG